MSTTTRRLLTAGILLLAALILVTGTFWIARYFFGWSSGMMQRDAGRGSWHSGGNFETNGERIYFTGTSATGPQITFEMDEGGFGSRHRMGAGMMACVDCHGADGRGGTVRMMMTTVEAPSIRYEDLTSAEHDEQGEEHEPYTDETLRQAITQGVDPAGEPLEWPMPRWNMTDGQLDDLIVYLKTRP